MLVGTVALGVGLGLAVPRVMAGVMDLTAWIAFASCVAGTIVAVGAAVGMVRRARGWRRWLAIPVTFVVLQFVLQPTIAAVASTNAPRSTMSANATDIDPRGRELTIVGSTGALGESPNLELAASWVPSRNGATVVVLPGAGSDRSAATAQAQVLVRHGYGVVVLDPRGHGRSGGHSMDLGWFGPTDVSRTLDEVARLDGTTRPIGVVGLSMGAEVAITTAAGDPRIGVVVAEGAGRRSFEDATSGPNAAGGLERIVKWEQYRLIELLTDAPPPLPLREAAAAMAPRPLLLIAGTGEATRAHELAAMASATSSVWEVSDAGHTQALAAHPQEWESRVIAALDAALLTE